MLRLLSYLAPSIPHGFFELVAKVISEGTGLDVHLNFNEKISGHWREMKILLAMRPLTLASFALLLFAGSRNTWNCFPFRCQPIYAQMTSPCILQTL